MDIIIPILIFVLILGIVIFIHELGHFLAARRAGVFVEEFAIGMGPKIFSFNGKKKSRNGETTTFSLRAFPIGGFCKMRGLDEDDDPGDPEALNSKSVPARALVMAGGSLMNFALAFVLFFALVMGRGMPDGLEVFIHEVWQDMPGYTAGLRGGDVITHVDSEPVEMPMDVITAIRESGGLPVEFNIVRAGDRHVISMTPVLTWNEDAQEYRFMVGFTTDARRVFRSTRIHEGFTGAARELGLVAASPFILLSQLAAGGPMPEGGAVMGPIGIGSVVVDAYQYTSEAGVQYTVLAMVFFAAFLNGALGIMNLLPIPALDGARLVFLAIEAIRRKPISPEKEAYVHIVGMVLMIALAIFIAYQDIARLINLNDYSR